MKTSCACLGLVAMALATGCPLVESNGNQLPSHCRPVVVADGGASEPPGVPNPVELLAGFDPGNDNYVTVDFANPAHRATLTEDGLEFVMSEGPWAIYRVTSGTPRLYIPGTVEPDHSVFEIHQSALCIGSQYFAAEAAPITKVKLMGSLDGPEPPTQISIRGASALEFGSCGGATDIRRDVDGTHTVTDMYIELDPAPPVGSLVPLMMVAIGSYDSALELPHMNEEWRICCPDAIGCQTQEPPGGTPPNEPPANEPPDDTDPPGGTEPPDGTNPPGGSEPPGTSEPPGECPPGYEPIRVE